MPQIVRFLQNLGLILNIKKSQLDPATVTVFLGMLIDSARRTIRVESNKAHKYSSRITDALARGSSAAEWKRLTGNLSFASSAVPEGRLWLRHLQSWGARGVASSQDPRGAAKCARPLAEASQQPYSTSPERATFPLGHFQQPRRYDSLRCFEIRGRSRHQHRWSEEDDLCTNKHQQGPSYNGAGVLRCNGGHQLRAAGDSGLGPGDPRILGLYGGCGVAQQAGLVPMPSSSHCRAPSHPPAPESQRTATQGGARERAPECTPGSAVTAQQGRLGHATGGPRPYHRLLGASTGGRHSTGRQDAADRGKPAHAPYSRAGWSLIPVGGPQSLRSTPVGPHPGHSIEAGLHHHPLTGRGSLQLVINGSSARAGHSFGRDPRPQALNATQAVLPPPSGLIRWDRATEDGTGRWHGQTDGSRVPAEAFNTLVGHPRLGGLSDSYKRHIAGTLVTFVDLASTTPTVEQVATWVRQQRASCSETTIMRKAQLIITHGPDILGIQLPEHFRPAIKEAAKGAAGKPIGQAPPIRLPLFHKALSEAAASGPLPKTWVQAFAFSLVAYSTTSRPGEIFGLTGGDVKPAGARGITIRIQATKTGRSNVLKLVPDVRGHPLSPARWLARHIQNLPQSDLNESIWRAPRVDGSLSSTPISFDLLGDYMAGVFHRVSIRAHGLRRGSAADLVLAGVSPYVVAAKGTWADINSMLRYIDDTMRLDRATSAKCFTPHMAQGLPDKIEFE
ncbi:hypothetical protein J8273_8192 [Carpediemonas membranifera]|uniref:Phage integrase family protein n=1 Tax=Carpediemonas membranifera TaxID=201153 RepID=A0A8J6B063_9EUKA|nr:hypothetical protein J8273_8192 [Carpediemonas membranifera]|eukprot:KAG9390152.1 hypothetical protein J8273_8192 [Carpediemonas membranifera]